MKLEIYSSNYINSPQNCLYPNKLIVKDETSAKEAFSHDYVCAKCGKSLKDEVEYTKSELDHIVSWKKGGLTEKSNCQLLCQSCNRTKSGK